MARIIVIDDEELVRFSLRAILEEAGHSVKEAADGDEGLALQKEQHFDIAIVDIFMPKKEGTETILEMHRDYPDLKLIAISGGGHSRELSYLNAAQTFGADLALPKPLTESDLIFAVNSLLR